MPMAARTFGGAPPAGDDPHRPKESHRRRPRSRVRGWPCPRDGKREPPGSPSWGGRLVDDDMATLRRRIREARAAEKEEEEEGYGGGGGGLPAEWTELERRHHGSYVAGVRGAVGLLQVLLVSARPGLGAGLLALLLLSVPASVLLVSAQLERAVDAIASAVLSGR